MSVVNPFQSNAGDTIEAAGINTPINQLAAVINGGIDATNITDGAVGSAELAAGAVDATKLSTGAITLGYASSTSDFTTASTTAVQITSLSAAVTIPAGGRRVKITVMLPQAFNGTAGNNVSVGIWTGTVGTGTLLSESQNYYGAVSGQTLVAMIVHTPTPGAITYNASLRVSNGIGHTNAAATYPAFILVEAI